MQERITTDPNVCEGRASIRDTQVPVSLLLDQLAAGQTVPEIIERNPALQAEDITAALTYAANLTRTGVTDTQEVIHYQLTAREVVDGLMKYRRSPYSRRMQFGFGVYGLLALLGSGYLPEWATTIMIFLGCMSIVISIFLFAYRPYTVRRAVAQAIRYNPLYTAPKKVAFDASGMVIYSTNSKSEVTWAYFKKLTQDAGYLYLHTDTLGTVMQMPKKAFDAAALERFLRFSQSLAQP